LHFSQVFAGILAGTTANTITGSSWQGQRSLAAILQVQVSCELPIKIQLVFIIIYQGQLTGMITAVVTATINNNNCIYDCKGNQQE